MGKNFELPTDWRQATMKELRVLANEYRTTVRRVRMAQEKLDDVKYRIGEALGFRVGECAEFLDMLEDMGKGTVCHGED